MKLEEIKPTKTKFTLSINEKDYFLRPFNLEDQVWVTHTMGDGLQVAFADGSIDYDILTRVVFRLIDDKRDFKKQNIKYMDESGEEIETQIGGYKLFQRMIVSVADKVSVMNAFSDIMVKSNGAADESELAGHSDDKKKGK